MKKQTAEGEENEFKGCLEVSEMRRKEIEGSLKPEPLLVENPGRFVLFPIQDNEVSQHEHSRFKVVVLLYTDGRYIQQPADPTVYLKF